MRTHDLPVIASSALRGGIRMADSAWFGNSVLRRN
jgi:hypothetical protein